MKTLSFRATIVVEDEEPNIIDTIANLSAGNYEVETTDDFIGEPTILLSKKKDAEFTGIEPLYKEDPKIIS